MTFAVSVGAALVVEALDDGADGADATEVSALGAGAEAVEVGAACVFNGARLSELVVVELSVVAVTLAAGEVERGAEATLERLEVVLGDALGEVFAILAGSAGALGAGALLRLGAGMGGAVSVTLAEVSVEAVEASEGAVAGGAVSALLAVCVAGSGALTTLSLRL